MGVSRMAKKTIEQQVAELTPEQKGNLEKIYQKYLKALMVIVLAGVVLAVGIFVYAVVMENQAKDTHEAIQATFALNAQQKGYDASMHDESAKWLDTYHNMKLLKPAAFAIASIAVLIGICILCLIYKVKYPYFSEKKYLYIQRMESGAADAAPTETEQEEETPEEAQAEQDEGEKPENDEK